MKPLLFALAVLRWLCYTTRQRSAHYYTNPTCYTIYWYFWPRWWLPFFWLLCLLLLPFYVVDGGLSGWYEDLSRKFNRKKGITYTRQGYGEVPANSLKSWYLTYTR